MARANRVTPEGAIVADPARGLFTGNRGILCDEAGAMRWPWRHKAWICCVLSWKGNRQPLEDAHRWTPLFFLDEAVALAAGHRPCAECRRAEYNRFRAAWGAAFGATPSAKEIDAALHEARIIPRLRAQRTHEADLTDLPYGTFIHLQGRPALLLGDSLLPWSPTGYAPPAPRPASGRVTVLTPAPTVATLRTGYRPALHASAF